MAAPYFRMFHSRILESLSVSVFLLDEDAVIIYLNESAQALIQASSHCVQNLPLSDFISGQASSAKDGLLVACQKSLQENIRVWLHDVEIALLNVPQSKQVDYQISRIDMAADAMLVLEIMPHDAGHIRHDCLHHFNSNQTVIRGLAHEIRNPLGGMRGAAQLLANELAGIVNTAAQGRELTQYTDIETFARKMISLSGQAKTHGMREFMLINDRLSTFLT